jgi:hypothetical protein
VNFKASFLEVISAFQLVTATGTYFIVFLDLEYEEFVSSEIKIKYP